MKILFVNTYHYRRAGAEVHALDLADELRRRGHEVRFFAMHHPDNLENPDSAYWVPEIDYPAMNAHRTPANVWRVVSRAIYSFPARRALARMLADWRPDVAHLHNLHVHLTPSLVDELTAMDVPVVWTLHDYKLICPDQGMWNRGDVCERCKGKRYWQCTVRKCKRDSITASLIGTLEAEVHRFLRLPQRVDAFIAPSDFLRRKFIEFGWSPDRLVHMANFNNLPLAGAVEMPPGRRVLYAGQVSVTKGVLTLVEALRHSPDMRLDIAGHVGIPDQLEELIGDDWQGAELHIHGRVGKDELRGLIDAAKVVVVPSEWYENSPYSVIEAFAHARPVVASRMGGLPELVVDGVNGLVVDPHAPEQIAAAVTRLLDDPELWARCAAGALQTAASRDADGYTERLEGLYTDVIGAHEAR